MTERREIVSGAPFDDDGVPVPGTAIHAEVRAAYERYLTAFVHNDLAGIDAVVS
jgi:hypothetical protein